MSITKLNYNVQGEERKKVVQIISEIIGIAPGYKKVPSCAYEIGTFTVSKEGVLSWTEDTDVETAKTVVAGLQIMRFMPKEERNTIKKVMEKKQQPKEGSPKQPQKQSNVATPTMIQR